MFYPFDRFNTQKVKAFRADIPCLEFLPHLLQAHYKHHPNTQFVGFMDQERVTVESEILLGKISLHIPLIRQAPIGQLSRMCLCRTG